MLRRARSYAFFVLAALLLRGVQAADLPFASPEQLGFCAEKLNSIDTFYGEKVRKGELAGIVVLVARHGKIAHFSAIGYADLGTKRKMEKDTIFRWYSQTKPITATALMLLYEEGQFQLDDPISRYMPEFTSLRVLRTPDSSLTDTVAPVREPTIHDLFRHTAGFISGVYVSWGPPRTPLDEAYQKADLFNSAISLEEMMRRLATLPLQVQPGTKYEYSLVQDVQARLVEILSGMPFDQFLQKRLFDPLGMTNTGFWFKADKASRFAAMHWSKEGELVPCDAAHGCPSDLLIEPFNVNRYFQDYPHKVGSYGLAGTTDDYWRFAQMLLNGGTFEGHRLLGPRTVAYMARDHLGLIPNEAGAPRGTGWGLGFAVLNDPVAAGIMSSEGSFYWAGAASTLFWIDPKEDLVVVSMTQHLIKAPTALDWPRIHAQLSAMIYGALR